ncbi:MAG: ABC transporter substrate-binding protein [Gordonia amarae]
MKSIIGRPRWRRNAVAAMTASLALVASACGGPGGGGSGDGDATGVTDDTIKIGSTQPLTGPAAPGYAPISKAMKAYYSYVNDNGGVNGRKIALTVEDDAYNPAQTLEKTRKLVQQDKVFAMVGSLGTAPHSTVLDFLNENKVPDLMVSSGSMSWNQPEKYPWTFGWQVDYWREGKVMANYVKENFAGKKYCTFGQSDDLGSDGAAGVESVLGKGALKVKEQYSATNQNVAPQIGKLQAGGCEVIFSFAIPGFTSLALGTAAKLGYRPQWVMSSVGADPVALKGYLGANAEALLKPTIGISYMPLLDDDNPWIDLFKQIHEKYNKGQVLDMTTLHGYMMSYAALQPIAAAGKDLTREGVIEALEKGIDRGPSSTPFAYSKDNHSGQTGAFMTRLEGLTPVRITPTYVTDDSDGPLEKFEDGPEPVKNKGIPTAD